MPSILSGWLRDVDELLRGERTRPDLLRERGLEVETPRLAVAIVVLGMVYGLCMGSFSLLKDVPPELANSAGRYWQVVASIVKTPLLFLLTLVVTLPSLYVSNALVGSRLRWGALVKLLLAAIAVNAAILASLGPIVAFFSLSTDSHPFIVLLNVAVFAAAGVLGLLFLLQTMHRLTGSLRRDPQRPVLPESPPAMVNEVAGVAESGSPVAANSSALDMPEGEELARHTRLVFRMWSFLFALVGAQMGWVLRPFIGSPDLPFAWFRERHSNFFGAVLRAFGKLLFDNVD